MIKLFFTAQLNNDKMMMRGLLPRKFTEDALNDKQIIIQLKHAVWLTILILYNIYKEIISVHMYNDEIIILHAI